jgi:hypothetical protein
MARTKIYFQVRPRYTPGSPAQVPQHVALRVAEQEPRFYERALSGIWGDSSKATADTEGLDFIAYTITEKKKGWEVHDLITSKTHFWPFGARCTDCNRLAKCERGVVQAHEAFSQLSRFTCDPQRYVGELQS